MRTGIMGGTYNPFHNGHYQIAIDVRRIASLDRLILIPSCKSPHKSADTYIASPLHRYTMAVLGTIYEPKLEVSPLEIEAGGVSYTYKSIERMKERLEPEDKLFFVTGIESFEKITTWKKWETLVDSVDFIVNSRAGYKTYDLLRHIPKELVERCILVKDNKVLLDATDGKKKIFVVETGKIDISASDIRERIAKSKSVKGLVHPLVEKYIELNKLYKKAFE